MARELPSRSKNYSQEKDPREGGIPARKHRESHFRQCRGVRLEVATVNCNGIAAAPPSRTRPADEMSTEGFFVFLPRLPTSVLVRPTAQQEPSAYFLSFIKRSFCLYIAAQASRAPARITRSARTRCTASSRDLQVRVKGRRHSHIHQLWRKSSVLWNRNPSV